MMDKVFVVIEGKEDESFYRQFINYHFKVVPIFIKVKTNARSLKGEDIKAILTRTTNLEHKTLFILDQDNIEEKSKKTLIDSFEKANVHLDPSSIFLTPDIDRSGNLEDLLIQIVNRKKADPIFACFESYKSCVRENRRYQEVTKP